MRRNGLVRAEVQAGGLLVGGESDVPHNHRSDACPCTVKTALDLQKAGREPSSRSSTCFVPCSSPTSDIWAFPQVSVLLSGSRSAGGQHRSRSCPAVADLGDGSGRMSVASHPAPETWRLPCWSQQGLRVLVIGPHSARDLGPPGARGCPMNRRARGLRACLCVVVCSPAIRTQRWRYYAASIPRTGGESIVCVAGGAQDGSRWHSPLLFGTMAMGLLARPYAFPGRPRVARSRAHRQSSFPLLMRSRRRMPWRSALYPMALSAETPLPSRLGHVLPLFSTALRNAVRVPFGTTSMRRGR